LFWRREKAQAKKILVADDNAADLKDLENLLRKEGYQVIKAKDGSQAQSYAIKYLPDVIILDVTMPMKNGYQVAHFLKLYGKTHLIPIILMSSRRITEKDINLGYKSGAAYYFAKPIDKEKLLVAIKDLLRKPAGEEVSATSIIPVPSPDNNTGK
jgi:DNA-binding response OmpR family regulator